MNTHNGDLYNGYLRHEGNGYIIPIQIEWSIDHGATKDRHVRSKSQFVMRDKVERLRTSGPGSSMSLFMELRFMNYELTLRVRCFSSLSPMPLGEARKAIPA